MKKKRLELDLAIDVGNTQVCVASKNYKDVFDSCFNTVKNGLINDNAVEFVGDKSKLMYQVIFTGEQQKDYAKNKELANKVFISYALKRYMDSQSITDEEIDLNLALGVPVKEYIPETLEVMKSWFNKPIQFKCNGATITYHIKTLIICPQGLSFQRVHKKTLEKYDICYLVDMGGFTIDIVKVVKGVVETDKVHSLKIGSVSWLTRLAEAIENDFEIERYTAKQAEMAVKKGYFQDPRTGKKIKIMQQYKHIMTSAATELVKGLVSSTNKDIMLSEKTFIFGGGAYTWGAVLDKNLPNIKSLEEPEMQNAKDFYIMLKAAKKQNKEKLS